MGSEETPLPLAGVRVIELGMYIAGPFAGQQLADLGAEVIKVEHPHRDDPMRTWRDFGSGDLWWPSLARNKRNVSIDLASDAGADVARRLAAEADIVLENFQPGTLERWGLAPADLIELNPRLVVVRVSGFGQTGPYSDLPGFGSIGEAMGGIRHLTGWPDRPSTRAGISLGDQICSLFAVIGALGALRHAERTGQGQVVDTAIYESVLALMESTVAEYVQVGVVRNRTGPTLPGVVPSNVYPTSDGSEVLIAGNSDQIFQRLMVALGRPDVLEDERFAEHTNRAQHAEDVDRIISERTIELDSLGLLELLAASQVPASLIYTAPEMLEDPHFQAREAIVTRDVDGLGAVPMAAPVPRFDLTPTSVRWTARRRGADTVPVLTEWLGLDDEKISSLLAEGAIDAQVPSQTT